jgi:hypothetical protein
MSAPQKIYSRTQWASLNPVLMAGELGIEEGIGNIKIGDGRTRWNQLPYHGSPGYWGSFWDTTSQTATANTPTSILLRKNDLDNRGVKVISDSRITVDHTGIYSFTFSIQFSNSDAQIHDINVWLRKNDSGASGDVPDSDSKFSIIASHGGIPGNVIGTVNFVLKLAAADYIELIWATSNAAAYIHAEAAATSPFAHPGIPGIICTVTQVASA